MTQGSQEVTVGELVVLPQEHRAFYRDVELPLTGREFEVLRRLSAHPGWVLSSDQLSDDDDIDSYASPFAVNVHVSHLRAKLAGAGARADLIETVRGVGWRLNRSDAVRPSPAQATELVGLCIARARRFATHMEFEQAVAALDEALEHLDAAAMEPLRHARVMSAVLERRGAAHSALQEYASAGAGYREALRLRPANDHLARARLHTRIAYVSLFDRKRGTAESALCRADAELSEVPVHDRGWWRAWIEIRLQQVQMMCIADLPAGEGAGSASFGEAVEAYGTDVQKARYHLAVADAQSYEARWKVSPQCLDHVRMGVEYAMRTDSVFVQAYATGLLGSMLVFAGDCRGAEVRLRQAIELAERCRDPIGVRAATMFLSLAARLERDVRRAERYALELRSLVATQPTLPEFDCTSLGQLAWVALKRRSLEEASRLSEEAIALWERDPSMSQSVWAMAWPALSCSLAVGDIERAVECATLMTRSDQQVLANDIDRRLAEVVAGYQRGAHAEAEAALRELEDEARTHGYA